MTWPPPYPRIAHLPPAPKASRDDLVLDGPSAARLLAEPVIVEEKLDGASVVLWREGDQVQAATRGGPDARDRAGQLGPLRAWVAGRADPLHSLLAGGRVLYGEWLWLRHGVSYDALPDFLIGLDLRLEDGTFAPPAGRDRALAQARVHVPPRLFSGVLGGRHRLDELMTRSRLGGDLAEGAVVRLERSGQSPRLAKVVSRTFAARTDDSWRVESPRNSVRKEDRADAGRGTSGVSGSRTLR